METVEGPSTGRRSSFLVAVPRPFNRWKASEIGGNTRPGTSASPLGDLCGRSRYSSWPPNNILTTQLPSLLLLLCTPHLDLRLSLRIDFSAPHLINSQLISYLRPRASENECIASFRPCAEGYCSQVMPLTYAAFPIYQSVLDQSTAR